MSRPTVHTEELVDRRHYSGRESFYVELRRKATLTDDLTAVTNSDVEHIVIYLGDGTGDTQRIDGQHNLQVGITVEMAEWLQSTLMKALIEVYRTRKVYLPPATEDEAAAARPGDSEAGA